MIRPVCSAIGTNSVGPTSPSRGCSQRASASTPMIRPVAQLGLGLVVELDLAALDRLAQAAGERQAARAEAVEAAARTSRGRRRPPWRSTSRCRRAGSASRRPCRARGGRPMPMLASTSSVMPSIDERLAQARRAAGCATTSASLGAAHARAAGRRTRRRRGGRRCRARQRALAAGARPPPAGGRPCGGRACR